VSAERRICECGGYTNNWALTGYSIKITPPKMKNRLNSGFFVSPLAIYTKKLFKYTQTKYGLFFLTDVKLGAILWEEHRLRTVYV
jgi:hypothetical protein